MLCIFITVTVTVTEALVFVPTRRPRAHHKVNPYLGAGRQNETKMFSDHDETSQSIDSKKSCHAKIVGKLTLSLGVR